MRASKAPAVVEDSEREAPADLRRAFAAAPQARDLWKGPTRIARRDFIRWLTSVKQPATRARRRASACDMLSSGERRVCCFDTSPWKTADHKSKYRRSSSR